MPGHYGNITSTIENTKVIKINPETQEVLIAGGLPGARNSWIVITKN